jgi:hypothetical protein
MRLQCAICKKHFEPYQRIAQIEAVLNLPGGTQQGCGLFICGNHLQHDLGEALGLTTSGAFKTHDRQTEIENHIYEAEIK